MAIVGFGEKTILAIILFTTVKRFFGGYVAALVLAVGLLVQFSKWYKAWGVWQRLGVPCPPSLPLLGHIIPYAKWGFHGCDPDWMQKYGKLYGCYFFTQPEIVIADDELLRRVLVKDFYNFTNRRIFDMSKKSIFTRMVSGMKNDEWKNTRNAITPAFTSGKLKNTVHLMENCVNTMCSILDEQGKNENGVDVRKIMGNLTLDVIATAAFAMDIDAQHNPDNEFSKHAKRLGSITFKDWTIMLTVLFPWTVAKLDEIFNVRVLMPGMEEFYIDMLSGIMKHRRESPKPITYNDIQRLPYLDAVIAETLRLFPPVTRFDRQTQEEYQLTDGVVIPKDSVVIIPAYAIHHSADFYDEPEKFDPERFLVKEKKPTSQFAYLPFGYGPRNCIGMRFAQLEMRLALSNALRKFRIEPCSKTEVSFYD